MSPAHKKSRTKTKGSQKNSATAPVRVLHTQEATDYQQDVIRWMLGNHEPLETILFYTGASPEMVEEVRSTLQVRREEKDSLFKTTYQNKHMFMMMIKDFIHLEWLQELTEKDLELYPSLFPAILQPDRESDIIYKGRRMKEDRSSEEIFFIMLECQSKVDYLMPLRILEYMCRLWRKYLQENHRQYKDKMRKLPAIIPIVYYNGRRTWTAETQFQNTVETGASLAQIIPSFEYLLIDLTKLSYDELVLLEDPQSLVMILDKLRNPEDYERLRNLPDSYWKKIDSIIEKLGLRGLFEQLVYMALKRVEATKEEIEEVVAMVRKGEMKKGMFGIKENVDYKRIRERIAKNSWMKGHKEGRMEGIIETATRMLRNGESVSKISRDTELSEKEVIQIKNNLPPLA